MCMSPYKILVTTSKRLKDAISGGIFLFKSVTNGVTDQRQQNSIMIVVCHRPQGSRGWVCRSRKISGRFLGLPLRIRASGVSYRPSTLAQGISEALAHSDEVKDGKDGEKFTRRRRDKRTQPQW